MFAGGFVQGPGLAAADVTGDCSASAERKSLIRTLKRMPWWVQEPLSGVMRAALGSPMLGALPAMADLAGGLGRTFGAARLNRKRLARADENLREVFPQWDADERRHHALAAYEHLFRLGVELAFSPRLLNRDGWVNQLILPDRLPELRRMITDRACVMLTGHVGNWELIGSAMGLLGFPLHAVYRPLDLAPLDAWVRQSRERQGITLVSKFGAVHELPGALAAGRPVGLVADQNGGDRGMFVPFFGRLTSTYKSIGLLAIQFNATVVCGFARRVSASEAAREHGDAASRGGLRYKVEIADVFGPEDWSTHPDPLFYLTARYRRALERMILAAPDQYLWMHRIWRSRPLHERTGKPFPAALREKMSLLPWMTSAEVERVVERSERERREAP